MHFKYVARQVVGPLDELLVVASALQINRKKKLVHRAVHDVVSQVSPTVIFHTAFARAMSDPCLQAADYLTWAVQRTNTGSDRRRTSA
jgi:NADH:ubiquinone oxidoreductase subunit H